MSAVLEESTRSIPNYRQQIRKALPEGYTKPHTGNLWWFPVHFAFIGVSLYLLTNNFSWWLAPILSLVIGHSMSCLGFVAHELAHGSSIQNPFWRDALAWVAFSPLAIGPHLWKRWHNSDHHNNTNVEGIDPDHLFTIEDYKHNPVLKFLYTLSPLLRNIVIFSSFSYRMTQHSTGMLVTYLKSPKSTGSAKMTMLVQWAACYALWIGGTLALGTQVFWWGYFVPLLILNAIVICYIATNHFLNPLADERDVLATSLTVTLPRWLEWLDVWHSRFGAHVAHHLFPQASSRYARQIENKASELFPDRYHSMPITTALRLLWNTPWVYEDKETLIDPRRQVRSKTLGTGLEVPKKGKGE